MADSRVSFVPRGVERSAFHRAVGIGASLCVFDLYEVYEDVQ